MAGGCLEAPAEQWARMGGARGGSARGPRTQGPPPRQRRPAPAARQRVASRRAGRSARAVGPGARRAAEAPRAAAAPGARRAAAPVRRTAPRARRPPADTPAPLPPPAAHAPPTVADTKRKFIDSYRKPIPSIYNVVVQELLVQQHFIRYNVAYKYNEARGRQRGWEGDWVQRRARCGGVGARGRGREERPRRGAQPTRTRRLTRAPHSCRAIPPADRCTRSASSACLTRSWTALTRRRRPRCLTPTSPRSARTRSATGWVPDFG
jgi:hypothetical protein